MIPKGNIVHEFFAPPIFEGDSTETHAARTLSNIILGTGICLTLYLLVIAIIHPPFLFSFRALLIIYPLLFFIKWITNRGYVKPASVLLTLCMLGGFGVIAFYEGGVGTAAFNGLLLPALLTFLLLGMRGGFIFSLLALGLGVLFIGADMVGWLPSPLINHTPISYLFTNFVYMLGAIGVLYIAIDTVQRSLFHSEQSDRLTNSVMNELERSEARYHAIVEDQTGYIHRYSLDGKVLFVNDAYAALFDLSPEEIVGHHHEEFMPTYLLDHLDKVRTKLSPSNPVVFNDYRYLDADGAERWLQWHNRLIFDVNGQPVEYQGIAREITEQKIAQEAIRRSETLYRTTIDAIDEMMHVVDTDLKVVLVNEQVLNTNQALGLTTNIIGRDLFDVFPFLDEGVRDEYEQVFLSGQETRTEESNTFDERKILTETVKIPIMDGEKVTHILTKIRDVTITKREKQILTESENRFRAVFENNPSPILIVDLINQVLLSVNPAFSSMVGYSRDELVGMRMEDLTHPEDLASNKRGLKRLMKKETEIYNTEKRYITKTGEIVWVSLSATIIFDEEGNPLHGLVVEQDITTRKHAEEIIQRKITELTTLHSVSSAVLKTTDEDELIENVTSIIGEILYPEHFGILMLDEERDTLSIHGSYRYLPERFYDLIIHRGEGITGQCLQQGVAIRYDDVREIEWFIHTTAGISSALAVPLKINDRIFGVLNAESTEVAYFSEADERLLITVAGLLATAIERARHYQSSQVLAQELDGLYRTALATSQLAEPGEYLRRVCDEVKNAIPHDAFAVMLVHPDEGELEIAFAADKSRVFEEVVGVRVPIAAAPIASEVIKEKKSLRLGDLQSHGDRYRLDHPIGFEPQSLLSVPMIRGEATLGMMTVLSQEPDHFTTENQRFFESLAPQITIAFENTRLYQSAHHQRELAEALRDTSNLIGSTLDFDEVLERVLQNLWRVVPHDAASIMTLDEHKLSARIIACRGYDAFGDSSDELKSISFPLDESSHLYDMLMTQESSLVQDVSSLTSWVPLPQTEWIQSYLSTPIIVEGTVIGFMNLDSSEVDFFKPIHAEHLQDFAHQAAIAIENAMLYKELEKHSLFLENAVREATEELRAAKEQVETILHNSPDAIILLSPRGTIEMVNEAFMNMFGYHPHEALGGSLCMLTVENQTAFCRTYLQDVITTRHTGRTELHAQHKDGNTFEVEMALAPIYVGQEIFGVVSSMRDISAMKQIERMKDAFVSNVSHELRTPITSLKLNHSLIKMNPRNQDVYLERQDREIRRLTDLIEDLLRLSRLDQERNDLAYSTFDLNLMAEELVKDRQSIALDQDLTLQFRGDASLSHILADHGLIVQALSVLITNALAYTPPRGEVLVRTELIEKQDDAWFVIHVSDSGPGISPEEEPYLFDRFFRGEAGINSGAPGTGLGLAIAKEIMERHGGKIVLTHQGLHGGGVTFSLWLPAERLALVPER